MNSVDKDKLLDKSTVVDRYTAFEQLSDDIKEYSNRVAHNTHLLFKEVVKSEVYPDYTDLNKDNVKYIEEAVKYFDVGYAFKDNSRFPDKVLPVHHVNIGADVFFADIKTREDFKALTSTEKFIRRIAKEVTTYHHEKWNGKGFPMGLRMEEIPIVARMCSICLEFEELTSGKSKSLNRYEAMKRIGELSSVDFDPVLVDVFTNMISSFAVKGEHYDELTDQDLVEETEVIEEVKETVQEENVSKDAIENEEELKGVVQEENVSKETIEEVKEQNTEEKKNVEEGKLVKKYKKQSKPLEMLYSPIEDIKINKIVYYKADLVINDRYFGSMLPIVYESVAEKYNKITELVTYGLEQVVEFVQMAEINNLDYNGILIRMYSSIIEREANVKKILKVIKDSKIDASKLIFEVPEPVLANASEKTNAGIAKLRQLGIKIAIRDFGTEYSSLFKLLDMDFDMVVISHRFLREITNNTKASGVVRSIIDMIRNLDAEEICEGVSTQEQLEILKRMGCRRMQGQIIGDPAPYKEYIR